MKICIERVGAMDYNKIEDSVLKKAMEIFRQSAVDFFGINTKIIAPAETEIKNIEIKTNYTDYLFYSEDGNYLHFEFQTTDKKDDIKRFLYYDASLFYKEKRKVRTIVIYSSDIERTEEYIDAGTIKYSIEAFYMNNLDGDAKLKYLQDKVENKETLNSKDILTLTLLPLMKGSKSKSQRTIDSIELAEKVDNNENKTQCISMLYALLEKFGDELSKNRMKEMLTVTEIGRMIRDEALLEGTLKGKAEGKSEILIKLLTKKFNKVPEEYRKEIKKLPEDTIDLIATQIFDFQSIDDIKKFF